MLFLIFNFGFGLLAFLRFLHTLYLVINLGLGYKGGWRLFEVSAETT